MAVKDEGRKTSCRCPVGRHQVGFLTVKEECQESSRQLGKKHPSPRFNGMAVKDGKLLEGQRPICSL